MRRKKKLLFNLLKIVGVIAIALILFFIFKPKKKINTANINGNGNNNIKVTTVNDSNIEIKLPTEIKDFKTNKVITSQEKTFKPLTKNSDRYFIPLLSNNQVTVLIGDDSTSLLPETSPVKVGNEYTVSGIDETIQAVYYFTVEDYQYPILLLLGKSGTLHYIDIENAYTTGNFVITGSINNIPVVQNIYQVEATSNGKTYRSAIIKCEEDTGYEFITDMIGR